MNRVFRDYPYKESGLDIVLVNRAVDICSNCDAEETGITSITKLHDKIARTVALKPYDLTGPEIRFLRTHLGWDEAEVLEKLRIPMNMMTCLEAGESVLLSMAKRVETCLRDAILGPRQFEFDSTTREWNAL